MEEKKGESPKGNPGGGPPYLVIAAVVIVVAVAAIAALYYPRGTEAQPGNPPDQVLPSAKVNVVILYSSKCAVCDRTNSILLFLDQKRIPYELSLVDTETQQGKRLASDYNVFLAPTALVDANSLAPYPSASSAFEQQFQKIGGKYVVPEQFYDGIPRQVMFLSERSGECSAQKGMVTVDELFDFMCPSCNRALPEIDKMKSEFNANAETGAEMLFRERDYPLLGLPSERIGVAYECARLQTDGNAFLHNAFDAMFGEKTPLRDQIMIDQNTRDYLIADDQNFYNVLEKIAVDSNVQDLAAFRACYAKDETILIAGRKGANAEFGALFGVRWVPTFVVDCQYVVVGADPVIEGRQSTIRGAICLLHPELKACTRQS